MVLEAQEDFSDEDVLGVEEQQRLSWFVSSSLTSTILEGRLK